MGRTFLTEKVNKDVVEEMQKTGSEIVTEATGLLKERTGASPPKEISAIRRGFEDALAELGFTLVVLIDDLDRCLPRQRFPLLKQSDCFSS